MTNVSFDVGYSGYIIVVQLIPHFFNQQWAADFGYQLSLSLSLQLLGYGLAGLSRRFLVVRIASELYATPYLTPLSSTPRPLSGPVTWHPSPSTTPSMLKKTPSQTGGELVNFACQ